MAAWVRLALERRAVVAGAAENRLDLGGTVVEPRQSSSAASLSDRVMAASMASQSAWPAVSAATITGTFMVDQARLSVSSPWVSIGPPASAWTATPEVGDTAADESSNVAATTRG